MKYYEELLKLDVFTLEQLVSLAGSKKAAEKAILRLIKKKYIKRIKRDLYTCTDIENKQSMANRFIIGSNINLFSYISYHSAFEYYGKANQVFYDVYVSSPARFSNFSFEGITYTWINSKIDLGVVTPETCSNIRITDIERTVIDCIDNIQLAGGKEELFECLESITNLNNDKLYMYLQKYNKQFLYQKAGFIFEKYKDAFSVSNEVINLCLSNIKHSLRYFDQDTGNEKNVYIKKWRLVVPYSIETYFNQGVDELV